jgi:hypothetical protein
VCRRAVKDRDELLVGASHFSAKQIRKLFPALPRSVHAVPTGPPLHARTAEDQRSQQRLAAANLDGHGVFTLEFGQLDCVGKVRDYSREDQLTALSSQRRAFNGTPL